MRSMLADIQTFRSMQIGLYLSACDYKQEMRFRSVLHSDLPFHVCSVTYQSLYTQQNTHHYICHFICLQPRKVTLGPPQLALRPLLPSEHPL